MQENLKRWIGPSLATVALVWSAAAGADSARSLCGYSSAADQRPADLSDCTFSQRQGYITVRIEDGAVYDFSPVGDSPGKLV